MAGKTVILKDANDFSVETKLSGNRFVRAGWVRSEQEQEQRTGAGAGDQCSCFLPPAPVFCFLLLYSASCSWFYWPVFVSVAFVDGGRLS